MAMISRAVTKEYSSLFCSQHFNITTRPDIDRINWMGGFEMSYPRLALIDGRQDPWRAAGVHAIGQPGRKSTTTEPFMLVDWGVHHWEENGPDGDTEPGLPPNQVVKVQNTEVAFVKAWLEEWEGRSKSEESEL